MKLIILLLLAPSIIYGQDKITGITWYEGLNWEQVKDKARKENKFIFIDCFATWCLPCKKMDNAVYVTDSVGDYVNANFIAIKVQMDSSDTDSEITRNWYAKALEIKNTYNVQSYPTFLFLSPNGNILHKEAGYRSVKEFISLCQDALDPGKQYYTLLKQYNNNKLDYPSMRQIVDIAKNVNDDSIAMLIGNDYIHNYLLQLSENNLINRENIYFITGNVTSSSNKAFQFILKNASTINKAVNYPGFSESWVNYIISKEEIDPVLAKSNNSNPPDWKVLKQKIKKKHNAYYADRVILEARIRWHTFLKDWENVSRYTGQFLNAYGNQQSDFDLAVKSWIIFSHSKNIGDINTAIKWTKKIIDINTDSSNVLPAAMDTYANLLHKKSYLFENAKVNNTAISIQEKALTIAYRFDVDNMIASIKQNLEKMKKGEPTWDL